MSISTKGIIKNRIISASEDSPIAVFTCLINSPFKFNAVFANTLLSKLKIEQRKSELVGVFYGAPGAEEFMRLTN